MVAPQRKVAAGIPLPDAVAVPKGGGTITPPPPKGILKLSFFTASHVCKGQTVRLVALAFAANTGKAGSSQL